MSRLQGTVGKHDHELLPAETSNDADPGKVVPQLARHVAENAIAGIMTEPIVDPLEVIEIAKRQRKRLFPPATFRDRCFQLSFERAAIGQFGQRISVRITSRLGKRFAQGSKFTAGLAQLRLGNAGTCDHFAGQPQERLGFAKRTARFQILAEFGGVAAGLIDNLCETIDMGANAVGVFCQCVGGDGARTFNEDAVRSVAAQHADFFDLGTHSVGELHVGR